MEAEHEIESGLTSPESQVAPGKGLNRAGAIESRGVEIIPEVERTRRPLDLFWVYFGAQQVYSVYLFGGLLAVFGLSWWTSVVCILLGTAIGTSVFFRMVLFGPRTGTNATVASSAFYGIRGRYLGSFLSQIISLGFNALAIWAGGQAIEFAFNRWFGTPTGNGALALAMVIVTAAMITICLYGHATIVSSLRFITITNLSVMVLLAILVSGHFSTHPAGTPYALGSFLPTFLLGLTIVIVNPVSYGTTGSDYSRYIPSRVRDRELLVPTWIGMFCGVATAYLIGVFITLCFKSVEVPFIEGMVNISPIIYLIPLIIIGLIGNTGGTAVNFYNATLDLQAIIWKLRRIQVAGIISAVTLVVAYVTVVLLNAVSSIEAFVTTVTVLITPWIVINLVGYAECRGNFHILDMHSFAGGDRGAYWFRGGFSARGLLSWLVGVVVGLLFTDTSIIHGPLAGAAGGVELGFVSAMVVGGACFFLWGRLNAAYRGRLVDGPKVEPENSPSTRESI